MKFVDAMIGIMLINIIGAGGMIALESQHRNELVVLDAQVQMLEEDLVSCNEEFNQCTLQKNAMQAEKDMEPKEVWIDGELNPGESTEILQEFKEDRDYIIHIESFGGSAWDVLAILNRLDTLRDRGYHIRTETYGFAMSAGWMIFNMGHERLMHEDAVIMTHCAAVMDSWGGRHNERTDPEKLGYLGLLNGGVVKRLLEMGLSAEDIEFLMYDEDFKWIGSEDALKYGIATKLLK